jgi:hypothetical protein
LPLDRRRGGAFTTISPAPRLLAAEELVAELTRPFLFLRRSACAAGATAGVKVCCEVIEQDRRGRMVARVFSPNGADIGRRLVSAGWALGYRRYSKDYVDAENEARKARHGIWRGTFEKPRAWRASSPPRRTQAPVLVVSGSGRRHI